MNIYGLPGQFWVVTKPSPVSTLEDILFPCSFERLMLQVQGGLHEDEIVGIYADEGEARRAAAQLLGDCPVSSQDAVFAEVVVNMMVQPDHEEITARELAKAAVEAVADAVRQGEKVGFRHHLERRISLGAGTVELHDLIVTVGGQVVLGEREPPGAER
jgi:hypothetical protein